LAEQRNRGGRCRRSRFETVHRQLHTGLAKPWNWHRAEQRQFWLLRSPGILSRRVPRGFLPPGRRLLDQPSRSMRIDGCGTLATNSMIRIGARDMPDRYQWGRQLALCGLQANHSAKARGSRDKSSQALFSDRLKMRSMLRNHLGAAWFARPLTRSGLPFLGQIAQIVIADRAQKRADHGQINRALRSRRLASSAPPQSSASSRGTVSGLPWSDQPQSQDEPRAPPSPFCAAARRLRA
jgi:hypothetical protein